jgi:hypothetical protein
VDEASQIELGDYIPFLYKYASTLKKVVFIGDDRQRVFPSLFSKTKFLIPFLSVPPYGAEQIEDLQSVFEIPHIRQRAIFLDTQCQHSDLHHTSSPRCRN